MAYEDDWIKEQIIRLESDGRRIFEHRHHVTAGIFEALLKKINNLEQEVKELRNGGKKK